MKVKSELNLNRFPRAGKSFLRIALTFYAHSFHSRNRLSQNHNKRRMNVSKMVSIVNGKTNFRFLVVILLISIRWDQSLALIIPNHKNSNIKTTFSNNDNAISPLKDNSNLKNRRDIFIEINKYTIAAIALSTPTIANSSNLPKDTGASFKKIGTIESLQPILQIKTTLQNTKQSLSSKQPLDKIYKPLTKTLPREETSYKKIFDEYSTPISYKQKFRDSNAFLVYYTKGYDGPNRPNIESEDENEKKQMAQYGARNDSWFCVEELYAELEYALKSGDVDYVELGVLVDRAIGALDRYLSLVPSGDLEEGYRSLSL